MFSYISFEMVNTVDEMARQEKVPFQNSVNDGSPF